MRRRWPAGVAVTVLSPVELGSDDFGRIAVSWDASEVDGVLVDPSTGSEVTDSNRPNGTARRLTLHFPKAYVGGLRGCRVRLSGRWSGTYEVVGDPMPYQDENVPGPWDMPVEVREVLG